VTAMAEHGPRPAVSRDRPGPALTAVDPHFAASRGLAAAWGWPEAGSPEDSRSSLDQSFRGPPALETPGTSIVRSCRPMSTTHNGTCALVGRFLSTVIPGTPTARPGVVRSRRPGARRPRQRRTFCCTTPRLTPARNAEYGLGVDALPRTRGSPRMDVLEHRETVGPPPTDTSRMVTDWSKRRYLSRVAPRWAAIWGVVAAQDKRPEPISTALVAMRATRVTGASMWIAPWGDN